MATQKATRNPRKPKRPKNQKPTAAGTTAASVIERRQLQQRAIAMRLAGATLDEIAEKLGYRTTEPVRKMLQAALSDTISDIRHNADAYVGEEALRIERLIRALWPLAIGRPSRLDPNTGRPLPEEPPDLKAIDRVVKLMERKARLLGLDTPVPNEPNRPDESETAPDDARELVVDRLARLMGAIEHESEPSGEVGGDPPDGGTVH